MTNTLSYDIARCNGNDAPICKSCRRKEQGRPEWQAYIAPSADSTGCKFYVAPVKESK